MHLETPGTAELEMKKRWVLQNLKLFELVKEKTRLESDSRKLVKRDGNGETKKKEIKKHAQKKRYVKTKKRRKTER